MNTETMRSTLEQSEAGKLRFPEVVRALAEAGVESYHADLIAGRNTFYMPTGDTHVEKLSLPSGNVAAEFSIEGLIAAIRGAQSDEIRYPEFVKRAMAAGTAAYRVFLTGRRVVYFGRKGEIHIEEFPRTKE